MNILPPYVKRCLLGHVRQSTKWIEEQDLSPAERAQYLALANRFQGGEPLSRIVDNREFWSLPFHLSPATLDPRADSETLIDAVLDRFPDKDALLKVLDLGSGSGCLLLATLKEYPQAMGIGVDIQGEALQTATKNAQALGMADRCQFIQTSWGEGLTGTFDIILCNPPYIRTDEFQGLDAMVKDYDPYGALVSGNDGLECYRQVIPHIARLLGDKGAAFLELGQGQGHDVRAIGASCGLKMVHIRKDLGGIERCLILA